MNSAMFLGKIKWRVRRDIWNLSSGLSHSSLATGENREKGERIAGFFIRFFQNSQKILQEINQYAGGLVSLVV